MTTNVIAAVPSASGITGPVNASGQTNQLTSCKCTKCSCSTLAQTSVNSGLCSTCSLPFT